MRGDGGRGEGRQQGLRGADWRNNRDELCERPKQANHTLSLIGLSTSLDASPAAGCCASGGCASPAAAAPSAARWVRPPATPAARGARAVPTAAAAAARVRGTIPAWWRAGEFICVCV